jgi:hypothetical protein
MVLRPRVSVLAKSVGPVTAGALLILSAGVVLRLGRHRSGRSRADGIARRLRAGVWALIGCALVAGGFRQYAVAGIAMVGAFTSAIALIVLALKTLRQERTSR